METLLIYFAKVNIALMLFYALYAIWLRKDTFIKMRRYFFLSAIVFSLIYPMLTIKGLENINFFPHTPPVETQATVMVQNSSMVIVANDANHEPNKRINREKMAIWILFGGIGAFTLRFLWQLFCILRIRVKSRLVMISGVSIYDFRKEITPFSFFGWIFIHPTSHSHEELSQILLHEQIHVRQWHSIDVILAELLCILFWWNPAVWLIKRDININLEYLADNGVLREGVNCKEYQYHLLRLTYHETAVQIVNNFNVSQLKQRIMMMNKTKSPARKLAKYMLIIPMSLALVVANSCTGKDKKSEETPVENTPEIAVIPDSIPVDYRYDEKADEEVFVVVENQPEFPGGTKAMMKFLNDAIQYPVEAQNKKIQGRVTCNFVVEKDGSITDVQIARGVNPLLDEEAVRVIELMPNWKPGMQKGEPVRVRYTVPVVFKLNEKDAKKSQVPPPPPPPTKYIKDSDESKSTDEVFVVVEKQPEFPGGVSKLMTYLSDNISYPKEAIEKNIQGRVTCDFIVEKDGSISNVKVVRGIDTYLDKEAVRVIESMPNWNPGKQRGQAVRVRYTLPVVFKLQK